MPFGFPSIRKLRPRHSPIGTATAIALAAAALLPAVGGWQILRDRRATLDDARQNIQTLSHALAQHAVRTIQEVDVLLSDMVERVESSSSGLDLRSFLLRRVAMLSQTRAIAVISSTGDLVADSAAAHPPVSVADRPYFAWHRDHPDRGLHFDKVVLARLDGRPAIPLSRRIDDRDGAFAGVAAAALLADDFQDFYDSLDVGPHGVVALWSEDATLLVRRPKLASDAASSGLVKSGITAKFGPVHAGVLDSKSSIDDVSRIVGFEHVGSYPLVLSVGLAVDDLLRIWRYESTIQGLVLAVASAALLLLAFRLERGRRVTRRDVLLRQETERRYRVLAHNASDLVLLKPWSSDKVSYVSPSSSDMLGWLPDELAAMPVPFLVHAGDRDRVARELTSLSADRSSLTSVHRLKHKDGHYVHVEARFRWAAADDDDGNIVMAVRDVTARHAAEERYRMLADATSDVVAQLDLDLTQRYMSPSCRSVLGYEPDFLVGGRPFDLIHPDDSAVVADLAGRLAAGGVVGDRVTSTYRFFHQQGHWTWIEAAFSLVRDPVNGSPSSLIGSLRDVSERQRAARHLQRAKEAAENAAQVKSEFVANMSHELRTPLTGILGIHDLLQADPTLDDRQRRYVRMAHEAGHSLLQIVNDILDLSKMEAGQMTIEIVNFDPRILFETCLELGRETAFKKGLHIEARLSGLGPMLRGDPNRTRQILLNLLTNAIKFTERGNITLEATYDHRASRLRVRISDTGVGIPPDKIALLFERFTQADTSITRRYGGTGLGLAISKRLVELMDGEIGVNSTVGEGSTFWFDLPMPEASRLATPDRALTAAAKGRTLRVLLAEDNELNQDIIAAMLRQRGHEMTFVSNGAAVLEALAPDHRFDVVLMDLQMPVLDGLSATQAIRRRERDAASRPIPIFGLTANALSEDVARCHAVGMDGHISKPIDWTKLFTLLNEIAGKG